MFNLLEMLLPKVLMFAEGEGGGEAAEAPTAEPAAPASTDTPATDIAPIGSPDVGGETKPPEWPDRDKILDDVKKSREPKEEPKAPEKGAEEPKKDEPPKDTPPVEAKKEFVKPEALLTDLIEGLDGDNFKGKTVKDFAEYVEELGKSEENVAGLQEIKDVLDKNGVSDEEFQEFLASREAPVPEELKKEDFDTDEEYREAKLKAEAKAADEERLVKIEKQQQDDRNKEFSTNFHKTIDNAISRHSDEATKTCLLSNKDIDSVIKILGNIPDDVKTDIIGLANEQLDSIAESKSIHTAHAVKVAVEAAKIVHIKEYINSSLENQKKTLEKGGQTPAPEFTKPPEAPKGSNLEDGTTKKGAIQMVKELLGKT